MQHGDRRFQLTPLEAATGILAGTEESAEEPEVARDSSPREALEEIVLPALLKPPCVVSFSGGRDSSAILALATMIAAREGLQAPIVSTLRFTGAARSAEPEWQELVIRHLSLDDWVIREMSDELDCVGPFAQPILRRHGLLWPMNAHFLAPHAALAAGGTLLTGSGGDQLLAPSRYGRHERLLRGQLPSRPRDLLRLGYAIAPRLLRRAAIARRSDTSVEIPWLRPHAQAALARAFRSEAASEPVRAWRHALWTWRSRALQVGLESFALVCGDQGAAGVHPFLEPRFVSALSFEVRRRGAFANRTEAMRALVGDLLPDSVCSRSTKATFEEVFWNRHTRRFLEEFDGSGVNRELVDVDALRRRWLEPNGGRAQEMVPLQAAWLAADRRSGSARAKPLDQKGAGFGQ